MSISEWPFYPDSLLDVMGENKKEMARELFQFLQAGCAVALSSSTTIFDYSEEWVHLDPQDLYFTTHCRFLRFEKNGISNLLECPEGNNRCLAWDRWKTKDLIDRVKKENFKDQRHEVYYCHLGLTDIVSPICVASIPVAALFSGQFLYEKDGKETKEIAIKRIQRNIEILPDIGTEIPQVELPKVNLSKYAENQLKEFVEILNPLTEDFKNKFDLQVKRIGNIAEAYWLQYKRSKEDEFIDDLRLLREQINSDHKIEEKFTSDSVNVNVLDIDNFDQQKMNNSLAIKPLNNKLKPGNGFNHQKLKDNLEILLKEICIFLHLDWVAFFSDWEGDGNILDLEACYGLNLETGKSAPHFNWNKAKFNNPIPPLIVNNCSLIEETLRRSLRFNTKHPPQLNLLPQLTNAFMIVPQVRGTDKVKTVFICGKFSEKIDLEREQGFLLSIYNLLTDDYRHDKRSIKIHESNNRWAEISDRISHQVRSALHPIQSGIDLIMGKLEDDSDITLEDALYYAKNVKRQLRHLAEYSKMTLREGGGANIAIITEFHKEEFQKCNISKLISFSVDGYETYLAERKISLKKGNGLQKNYEAEIVPDAFETVVRNILENATKYARFGTYISVDITIDEDSIIWARYMEIIIQNIGYGVLNEEREKIFDKGVQGSLRDDQQGEGLGLFEAEQIIQGHGGSIRCDSNPRGSGKKDDWKVVFTIKIPISQEYRS